MAEEETQVEILKDIRDLTKEMVTVAKRTETDTNQQLRRVGTRLEEFIALLKKQL